MTEIDKITNDINNPHFVSNHRTKCMTEVQQVSTTNNLASKIQANQSKLTDTNNRLTTFNPGKIKSGIDKMCGPVKNVEYQKSGSIICQESSSS